MTAVVGRESDAAAVMARAYPGGERAEKWSDVVWRAVLDAAEWQENSLS